MQLKQVLKCDLKSIFSAPDTLHSPSGLKLTNQAEIVSLTQKLLANSSATLPVVFCEHNNTRRFHSTSPQENNFWDIFQFKLPLLTVSLFSALTSIIPLSKAWQSGGIKWGIWNTPLFTFSRSCRRLSWSKGKAPWGGMREDGETQEEDKEWQRWEMKVKEMIK